MWKMLGWLALLAIIGRTLQVLTVGFTNPQSGLRMDMMINRELGGAIFVFIVGAIGAGIAAFVTRKKRDPYAGLTTGTVLIVSLTALLICSELIKQRLLVL